jgi:hypothetical protein
MVFISDKYSLLTMVMAGILIIQFFESLKISDLFSKTADKFRKFDSLKIFL